MAKKVIQTNVSVKDMKKRFERDKNAGLEGSANPGQKHTTPHATRSDASKLADVLRVWKSPSHQLASSTSPHHPAPSSSIQQQQQQQQQVNNAAEPTVAVDNVNVVVAAAAATEIGIDKDVAEVTASVSRLEVAALAKVNLTATYFFIKSYVSFIALL